VNDLIPGVTRSKANPNASQEPAAVYPRALALATLPSGGPTGRVFFNGEDYSVYTAFNVI